MTPIFLLSILLVVGLAGILAIGRDLISPDFRWRSEQTLLDRLAGRPLGRGAGGEANAATADRLGWLERRLKASGLRVAPAVYLAATAAFGLLVLSAAAALLPGAPVAALVVAGAAMLLPWLALGGWARRRAARFEERLTDTVGFMIAALTAGENLTRAFAGAAHASAGSVGRELAAVARRLKLGMGPERALNRIYVGYPSPGVRLFVQTLIAKSEVGGDLVPLLESVNRTLRERLRLRLRLRSHLSGARLASIMAAVVPYAVIPAFVWRQPESLQRLLHHPLGPQLIVFAVLIQIFGLLWLQRMLRVKL